MRQFFTRGDRRNVEIVSDLARLRALEAEWQALASRSDSPLTQFEWFVSAAEAFRADRLFVVTVRRDGRLAAAAPLVLTGGKLGKRLEALGHQLGEPQQLVFEDEDALRALLQALARIPYPLAIRKVLADAPENVVFSALRSRGLRLVTGAGDKTAFVPLNGTAPPLDARMSKSRRTTLRRKRNMAEKLGPVSFRLFAPDPGELDGLLDEVFRVEASGWKGRAGTGLAADADLGAFFRIYCRRAAARGVLRLGFMRIGDGVAAVRIDVEWGRKIWELKIGYDERFAACSPGLLLGHEALLDAQARGLEAHHFLGQYEPWHDSWAAEQQARLTLRHYPASAPGGIALIRDALPRLKSALGLQAEQRA